MSLPMTEEEIAQAQKSLDKLIDAYAHLIVRSGVNIAPGQPLVITAPVEVYDFVRKVVKWAYKEKSGKVTVMYEDDLVKLETYQAFSTEFFDHVPAWKKEQMESFVQEGAAFLRIAGRDPKVFKDVDPAKFAAETKATNRECSVYRNALQTGELVWCIAAVPVQGWAKQVFPSLSVAEAQYRLWTEILKACRVFNDNPMSAWETHNAAFKKNLRFLNERKFKALRYTSENGTNFTIGIPKEQIWEGGASKTQAGQVFFPNIPTEEVFSAPHRLQCDGVVHSALPLVYQGSIIEDFWLKFEDGAVVDFDARVGKDVLHEILRADEGAKRLGEVALISKNTPIRESEVLFYNTLYDENASCHLALGSSYPECIENGCTLSKEERLAKGLNDSVIHVDFMIGSDDLTIMGINDNGEETRVFVNGQWAWE